MSVSVIIVNYNTGMMLNDVVQAALKNTCVSQVIIVDNNSHDNSMELVGKHQLIQKYFRKKNHGFASSCNYGAQLAHSDAQSLLFLNPDCLVEKTSIDVLQAGLEKYKNTGLMGCRVNNPDGTEQRASRRRLPTFWRALKTFSKVERLAKFCQCFAGVNLNHQEMPQKVTKVEAISGALLLIKTKVFNQIKGFDENFPLHFEDLDLCKRIRDNGYDIMFNPHVAVIHHQGLSSKSNPQVAKLKKQGLQLYFKKHCSKLAHFLVKVFFA